MEWPLVVCLLITYKRTDLALRTINGVIEKLDYPNIGWVIADDGSPEEHVAALVESIGRDVACVNANRKGVGVSMNLGSDKCLEYGNYILWLEDDWELQQSFDLKPCVQLMEERQEIGMVRLGYASPGIEGQLISAADRLWWKLKKGSDTYVFSGHASLRHKRFIDAYLPYATGLTPGETELYMCGTFNNKEGPDVVIPSWTGQWGPFSHIGGESLNSVKPE